MKNENEVKTPEIIAQETSMEKFSIIKKSMFGEITNENKTCITINGTSIESSDKKLAKAFNTSTLKTLDIVVQELAKRNSYGQPKKANREVEFSISDYLNLIGKEDTKNNRANLTRKITKDLDILSTLSLKWVGNDGVEFDRVNLATRAYAKNGKLYFAFTPEICQNLITSQSISYPLNVLKLDNKHAYYIGKKLATYAYDNKSKHTDGVFLLSVKSLLAACPTLPNYEDLQKEGHSNYSYRIKEPFEKAMQEIGDKIFYWQYTNAKKKPLTQEQLDDFKFDVFYNSYIMYSYQNQNMDLEIK